MIFFNSLVKKFLHIVHKIISFCIFFSIFFAITIQFINIKNEFYKRMIGFFATIDCNERQMAFS